MYIIFKRLESALAYISHVELLLSNDSGAVKHVLSRASSNTEFILKEGQEMEEEEEEREESQ